MNKRVMLVILDGWGITQDPEVSAVAKANTTYFDSLISKYPNSQLLTHGMNVGLPDGQMGNSEVGHMNLGAGRIVYQDLAKINLAVKNKSLSQEPVLEQAFDYAKRNNKPIHFLGLLSNGGVHSHIDHLKGLLTAADEFGVKEKYVHAFTDGRDVDPHSGLQFIQELQDHLNTTNTKLASVVGRYFAMDRDRRWERIKKAYDLMISGVGEKSTNITEIISQSYDRGISDEFLEPVVLTNDAGQPVATLKNDEVVIFFNFRTDRGRQLTEALSQVDIPEYDMKKIPSYFVTLTTYDETFTNVNTVFKKDNIKATLGEVLEYMGKTQLRIAETEKYPHVTFFFSGGREQPFKGEKRIMVNSPKVATYDLKPEMSAFEIRDKLLPEIKDHSADFICLNFANPDMVGHTGVFAAAKKACETVDECLRDVVEAGIKEDYSIIVIADHGNCEMMINPDGSPNTAHTTNPVPLILIDSEIKSIKNGNLGDIAPTILKLMEIQKPELMTQDSLI